MKSILALPQKATGLPDQGLQKTYRFTVGLLMRPAKKPALTFSCKCLRPEREDTLAVRLLN